MTTEAEAENQQRLVEHLIETDGAYRLLWGAYDYPSSPTVKEMIKQAIMQIESDEMDGD